MASKKKSYIHLWKSRIYGSNPPGQVTDFIKWEKNSVKDLVKDDKSLI